MQALQWDLKSQWTQHQGNLSYQVQISEKIAKGLQWWLLNQDWVSGRFLSLSPPELTVVMDASLLDCGGYLGEGEIRGLCRKLSFISISWS